MIDPLTAVGLATSAFNILKQGLSAGKDIQEMSGTLAKWGAAFSDFQYAEHQSKNPPWYNFKGSDAESAIEIFAQRKKMEAMRKEIKEYISWNYGPSAWEEVLQIEGEMRKQRKQDLYRKEEFKRAVIEWTLGIIISCSTAGAITFIIYHWGRYRGQW